MKSTDKIHFFGQIPVHSERVFDSEISPRANTLT